MANRKPRQIKKIGQSPEGPQKVFSRPIDHIDKYIFGWKQFLIARDLLGIRSGKRISLIKVRGA